MSIRLALFQPDIPQNAAAVIRTAACLGVKVDVIEPCGFLWGDNRMRRAGLDYLNKTNITLHPGWDFFQEKYPDRRRILLTTKTDSCYTKFQFEYGDILLLGRETAGVPKSIHKSLNYKITIPMKRGLRSFNLGVAAAMVTGEALRQLEAFPEIGNEEGQ